MTNESVVKPCRVIATVMIVTVAVTLAVIVALFMTIFRPRDPTFTVYLVGMHGLNFADLLRFKNLTSSIVIGVRNENYGSVSWQNLTVLVHDNNSDWYRRSTTTQPGGVVVGEIPIPGGIVSQRSAVNITTNATIQLDKFEGDLEDVVIHLLNGGLDFTCSVTAFAEIRPFNILPRIRGSISVDCFGSVYINKSYDVVGIGVFGGQAWCWTVKKRVVM
ncbi:hypothetical protein LINGRAHAP2_LOCUS18855 [Linum grandiflorum]